MRRAAKRTRRLPPVEPTIVPGIVVAVLVVLAGVAVLVVLALDRGDPADTAVAYEEAWDRLDFDVLWALSAPSMREGRTRSEFLADKRAAYAARADLAGLVERVLVERVDEVGRRARVVTALRLRDGGTWHNELTMRRHAWRWVVDGYRLGPGQAGGSSPTAAG